jgi:hypothetical protein
VTFAALLVPGVRALDDAAAAEARPATVPAEAGLRAAA